MPTVQVLGLGEKSHPRRLHLKRKIKAFWKKRKRSLRNKDRLDEVEEEELVAPVSEVGIL